MKPEGRKRFVKLPHATVVVHFAIFGGASVLASRLVRSLAPPNCTTTHETTQRRGA